MSYMLDTNICVFALRRRGGPAAEQIMEHRHDGLYISSIVLSELMYGIAKSQYSNQALNALNDLQVYLHVLPFDSDAAEEYGYIRAFLEKRSMQIGHLDTLIAAHAKAEGLTLVTNNIREFSRVPGLILEDWSN